MTLRFLPHLDPLAKVAGPLPAMLVLVFARDLRLPLTCACLTLGVLLIGARLDAGMLRLLLLWLPLVVLVLAVSLGAWTDPSRVDRSVPLAQVGDLRLYLGSVLAGLATTVRLAAILLLAMIGGLTTSGTDLVRAAVQHLRLPYRVGYTALAAFRFVPRFRHELGIIVAAHRVRGSVTGRGPVAALRRQSGYLVPLLAGAVRHAQRVALAMESRGFGAYPTRTERHRLRWHARDTSFVAACWCLTLLIPFV
ncbi:energy-coupling factor transporter transmembrane component T [Verrucosispora sp. WMMD573]|uniref:energy-coupling factor transporter transmembrane component T n=1 Tax=Verrucosispora sp. WMMD573 TaxID=3015149 RepID=UPI00248C71A6|nr:energy-coupling factor transporter transmembrane component T [Verrucosispora sp. WMMD573]WBB53804.1 energy-coupling factor transporter transmembrane component T [Verrucosispora sp. WMMD573]